MSAGGFWSRHLPGLKARLDALSDECDRCRQWLEAGGPIDDVMPAWDAAALRMERTRRAYCRAKSNMPYVRFAAVRDAELRQDGLVFLNT